MKETDPARNRAAFCPSCERFIGPADVCPYCDADSSRPPLLRFMRGLALALALAGVAAMLLLARSADIPTMRAGEITPTMNFAFVRVAGTVARQPYLARGRENVDYVSFLVDDGTGEIRVAANGRSAREMVARAMVPRKGDSVDLAGTVNVGPDGKVKLRLQSADQLQIAGRSASGGDSAVPGEEQYRMQGDRQR